MTIGNRIKNLRKRLNYSQEYLAEELGVSRQAVSKWEKDITKPDTTNTILLAKVLNSSVQYIAAGEVKEVQNGVKENKNKKVTKKQKIKLTICISAVMLLILVSSLVIYIATRPVDFDVLACGGGYTTHIYDKYSEELVQKFLNGMEDGKNVIYIKSIRGTQNADWKDNKIFLEFDVEYEHKEYGIITERIHFIGTRYWIECFKWSGAIIEG